MNLELTVGQGREKVSFRGPVTLLANLLVDFHAGRSYSSILLCIAYYLMQHYNGRLALILCFQSKLLPSTDRNSPLYQRWEGWNSKLACFLKAFAGWSVKKSNRKYLFKTARSVSAQVDRRQRKEFYFWKKVAQVSKRLWYDESAWQRPSAH